MLIHDSFLLYLTTCHTQTPQSPDIPCVQVPPPLDSEDNDPSFVMVSREDCELSGDREEVFEKIKQDLIAQIRVRWYLTLGMYYCHMIFTYLNFF